MFDIVYALSFHPILAQILSSAVDRCTQDAAHALDDTLHSKIHVTRGVPMYEK
jgi:hypothetical protein